MPSLESLPTCQDFQKRLDLFLDGEVDGRTMRELALHVTRCPDCESELRQGERLQDVFGDAVRREVERVDVAALWRSIESAVEAPRLPLAMRLRERWETRSGLEMRFLAIAASAALAVVIVSALWPGSATTPGTVQVAEVGETGDVRAMIPLGRTDLRTTASNKARIDSLSSSASAVAVWSEPRQDTTAIWVSYDR